jgi:hypothetical protein
MHKSWITNRPAEEKFRHSETLSPDLILLCEFCYVELMLNQMQSLLNFLVIFV